MTIGIAIGLEDGALLVADGRSTRPFGDAEPPTDDNNKIDQVAPLIGAISFGFRQATENSISVLRNHLVGNANYGPQEIQQLVYSSVDFGWEFLINHRLEGDYDLYHPAMKAALIVAGLVADIPFVTGTLVRANPEVPGTNKHHTLLHTDPHNFFILGGEQQGAEDDFARRALEAYNNYRIGPAGSLNTFVPALRDAAAETIQMVAKVNPEVGGTIHYACIRQGSGYTAGSLTSQGTWT
jgi:hypothetical protein